MAATAQALDVGYASDLDPEWYLRSYPQAVEDIAAGRAADAVEHFGRFGSARGYLPNFSAARPRDPVRPRSMFGGLWADRAGALDLVEGKLELEMITDDEAATLRSWIADGFAVLPRAIPDDLLEPALADLELMYAGGVEEQRFWIEGAGVGEWAPEARVRPAKALDPHQRSAAIRDLIFAPAIVRFLGLIFERPPFASQTLGFYRGSAQEPHQDSRVVCYTRPMEFAASWIALEDVTPGAGELFYLKGSHLLPDQLFEGGHKSMFEPGRLGEPGNAMEEADRHDAMLRDKAAAAGMPEETLNVRRGDVMIWSADLAHGGRPISTDATRRSMVAHYCPKEIAPLSFEKRARHRRRHASGGYWVSDGFADPQTA